MSDANKPRLDGSIRDLLRSFLESEAAGGLLLMAASAAALIVANSPAAGLYFEFLHVEALGLSILHWVNDGLMALFFLLVGLEIKRELIEGHLSTWPSRALPGIAALGGMVVPALIFAAVNFRTPETLRGWAIPSATDIAFALSVLTLLGPRIPMSLKAFLAALAILDDLGAVIIIALFYAGDLSYPMLALSAAVVLALVVLNYRGVDRLAPYLLLGAALWLFMVKSGIHATIAGVALAATIPLQRRTNKQEDGDAALIRLEQTLQPWVAFAVVPLFGFANAGLPLWGLTPADLLEPLPLGIALGLFIGKQVGVFGAASAAIGLGIAQRPADATWTQLYGVSVLCGIGFTMSLFIGLLAFAQPELQTGVKAGVLAGSIAAGLAGALVLRLAKPA